jgi:hypothetical protein
VLQRKIDGMNRPGFAGVVQGEVTGIGAGRSHQFSA